MTATQTTTEFAAFVTELVGRKVQGQRITETRDGYRVEISTSSVDLYAIDVRGPQNSWTRRRDVSKTNIARVASELHAEIAEQVTVESATVEPNTAAQAISTVRSNYAALRRLATSGGRTAATTNAIARRRMAIETAVKSLPRGLAGDLAYENTLIENIATSRRNGIERPELAARLANCRRQIRINEPRA